MESHLQAGDATQISPPKINAGGFNPQTMNKQVCLEILSHLLSVYV